VAALRARSTNIAGISCLSLIVSEIREIMRLRRDGARIYPTAADEARPQSAARFIAKRKTTSERLCRMIADSSATANDQLLHLHVTTIN
jgi:hypothetical protein